MKQFKLIHIFFFFSFLWNCKSSFIYYLDLSFDYPNANEFTTLSFSFSLDTTIENTDYLKIFVPFEMHASVNTLNVPADMTV